MAQPAQASWIELLGRQVIHPRKGIVGKERALYVKIIGCILLNGVSALFYIWIHYQNISMEYALGKINHKHDELLQGIGELQIEWEMLRAPQRISRIAEQELGMIQPDPQELVIVK